MTDGADYMYHLAGRAITIKYFSNLQLRPRPVLASSCRFAYAAMFLFFQDFLLLWYRNIKVMRELLLYRPGTLAMTTKKRLRGPLVKTGVTGCGSCSAGEGGYGV